MPRRPGASAKNGAGISTPLPGTTSSDSMKKIWLLTNCSSGFELKDLAKRYPDWDKSVEPNVTRAGSAADAVQLAAEAFGGLDGLDQ